MTELIDKIYYNPGQTILVIFGVFIVAGIITSFIFSDQLIASGWNVDTIDRKIIGGIGLGFFVAFGMTFLLTLFFTIYHFQRPDSS